jgi:hypothetical protein
VGSALVVLLSFLILRPAAAQAGCVIRFPNSPWSWRVFGYNNDLWMRSSSNNVEQFDFRIGAGGCVAEMRACYLNYQSLLCPASVNGALPGRDNVLQWVMWAGATTDGSADWGSGAIRRWNINQAGGHDAISLVNAVQVSATTQSCSIEIYVQADQQFMSGYNAIFRSAQGPDSVYQSVRYDLLDKGILKITHSSVIPAIHRTNSLVPVDDRPGDDRYAYFENWNAFYAADGGKFNGVARRLHRDGSPSWWYQFGHNIPHYRGEPLSATDGYAVAFKSGGYADGSWPVVGVVFGKRDLVKAGATGGEASSQLNLFEAHGQGGQGYVSILAACRQNLPVPGSIVSYETYLVARQASGPGLFNDLTNCAAQVAPPTIYPPGADGPGFARLRDPAAWGSPRNTQRIEALAPIAGGLTPLPSLSTTSATLGTAGLSNPLARSSLSPMVSNPPGPQTNLESAPILRVVGHAASGGLVLGATGPAGAGFRVLESTNPALPPQFWTSILTNAFDAQGRFQFTTQPPTDSSPRFYRLDAPWH